MRILFVSHVPLEEPEPGTCPAQMMLGLQGVGHMVRALVADRREREAELVPTRRVIFAADEDQGAPAFDLPRFAGPSAGQQFTGLAEKLLANYRQKFRQALDEEIARFDPQIIHAEHAWLAAHLALESGVPYVVVAHAQELAEIAHDARYHRLVAEAAENAGRILAASPALVEQVRAAFGELDGRILVAPWTCRSETSAGPPGGASSPDKAVALVNIYAQVLDERLGHRWRA